MDVLRRAIRLGTCACALLVAAAAAAWAQTATPLDPAPFRAEFDLEARGLKIAQLTWALERDAAGLRLTSHSEATGVAALLGGDRIDERSEWARHEGGLRPVRYRYTRTGRRDRSAFVDFDWSNGMADIRYRDAANRIAIAPGTVDALGYVLVLMHELRGGGRQFRFPVVNGKGLRDYVLKADGTVRLDTALGSLDTVRVVREREGDERETTLWLAPSLEFVPVRIEHRERDGEHLVITIRSLEIGTR